jgi:hypothetical protein
MLSPELRHALLLLAASVVSWGASVLVPALHGQTLITVALSAFLTALGAVLTPAVQAYGVGSKGSPPTNAVRNPE